MYYVYFLLFNNGQVYKGQSSNLQRRLKEHKNGQVKSTASRRPVALIGYEGYKLKSDAVRREKFLKTTEGNRLLRRQYRDIIQKLRDEGD